MSALKKITPPGFIILVLLFWNGSLFGSSLFLYGVVAEDDSPVPDVEVMLANQADGVILNRKYTDSSGKFRFPVRPGVYKVGAFKDDYSVEWRKDVLVDKVDVTLKMELQPEAFAEEHTSESDDCDR